MPKLAGRCLCGAVRFAVEAAKSDIDACHCGMCRRWAGGPLMTLRHAGAVEFTGEENISRYASSDVVERGFCKTCGSNLFTKMKGADHYFIAAGTLDAQDSLKFTVEIFIDDKPHYYAFANDTKKMTGAEFLAAWSGDGEKS